MMRLRPFSKISILAVSLAVVSLGTSFAKAANPELVGVIAIALDPLIAKELELTEEQLTKLRALAEQQEANGLNMASSLRELPPSDRDAKKRVLVREFEQLAFKELTIQQRGRLERIRLSKLGLASLAEAEVSEMLGLSQGQNDQIQQILSSRLELVRSSGEVQAKSEIEKRLRGVLTAGQWATWQALAGQSARTNVAATILEDTKPNVESPLLKLSVVEAPRPAAEKLPATQVEQPIKPKQSANVTPQPTPGPSDQTRDSASSLLRVSNEKPLTLNFDKMPWEQVLQWISKEAELSLQVDTFPAGTFTYRDPYRKYSVGEAIDVMNGVLLKSAFRLIRRQRSLMVLELGDGERSEAVRGLLREFAELVPAEELDNRGEFELLKCLFVLTRLSPEEAQRQITLLLGPEGSTIPLGSAGQILVTETAGKLKLIREMLKRVEDPDSSLGSKILTLHLKHVAAEEVLSVARGLLGLTEGVNSSDEIRMSTDSFGNTIFATGMAEKLQLLKDAVTQIDVKPGEGSATAVSTEQPQLRVHAIQSSDPDTAFNVLQTLLEGSPNTRMTLEPKTNSIVASASEADHKLIDDTLKTLAGESSSFTVFPLKRLDTQTALTTLEKMFGKSGGTTGTSSAAASAPVGPIFLGDSLARTIMVKGSPQELAQVREVLAKLEESGPDVDTFGSNMRVLPMTGKSADRMLDQIQFLWDAQKKKNRIKVRVPGEEKSNNSFGEKAAPPAFVPPVNPAQPNSPSTTSIDRTPHRRFVGTAVETPVANAPSDSDASDPSDIVIYRGPTGLVITCDDPKVLAEFEQLVRMVTDQMMSGAAEPTVFYLKYVTAKSAEELLRSILAGDASGGSATAGGGGLLGNVLGEMGGGLVGGLLGIGGGSSGSSSSAVSGGMASGEVTITADPRLNSLLVTANPIDLDLVGQLLGIIDKEDSPLRIETQGIPHIIPVIYSSAEEIAEIVSKAFADKMGQSAAGGGGGQRQQQQPSPQEFIEALRGAGGGGRGGGARSGSSELKPQTMTVSVDKKNNALIVTASNSLADQVRAFVATIDQASETGSQKIEVVQLNGAKTELFQTALKSMFGEKAKSNSNTGGSNTSTASSPSGSPSSDAEANERRAEFLRAIQSRFGPGGGGPGGGGPGGGFRGGVPGFGGGGGGGTGTRGGPPGGGGR
jgi:type II secretory pathway component GspD/PulD (secretin)